MGIFDRFPSTKLNDINLDWILKKIRSLRGGATNQILAKASDADFDFKWVTGGGGGGTSDYNELVNRPQINDVTLAGNLTASDLGLLDPSALTSYRTASAQDTIDAGKQSKIAVSGMLKGDGNGGVSAATAGVDYLAPSALDSYRTASAQDTIDAAQDANIGIVITGARPSMAVANWQYVIVRDSTISGITDGLYVAVNALSPSTDVTAADLAFVSNGGLNHLKNTAYMTSSTDIADCNTAVNGKSYNITGTTANAPFDWAVLFQIGAMADSAGYKMQIAAKVDGTRFAIRMTTNSWQNTVWQEITLN